jgi:hypothetical protein
MAVGETESLDDETRVARALRRVDTSLLRSAVANSTPSLKRASMVPDCSGLFAIFVIVAIFTIVLDQLAIFRTVLECSGLFLPGLLAGGPKPKLGSHNSNRLCT